MTLAAMLSEDRDAFVCDMAETYQILDYRALPVSLLAVLASGLREDSRIKMKIAGIKEVPLAVLAAHCVDSLALILYVLGAKEESDRPRSMIGLMTGTAEKRKETGFRSVEDYEAARNRIIAGE